MHGAWVGRGRLRQKPYSRVQLPGDSNDSNKNSTSTYSSRPLRDGVFLGWSSLLQRQTDRPSANLSQEVPSTPGPSSRAAHPPYPPYVLHHSFWLGSLDPSEFRCQPRGHKLAAKRLNPACRRALFIRLSAPSAHCLYLSALKVGTAPHLSPVLTLHLRWGSTPPPPRGPCLRTWFFLPAQGTPNSRFVRVLCFLPVGNSELLEVKDFRRYHTGCF